MIGSWEIGLCAWHAQYKMAKIAYLKIAQNDWRGVGRPSVANALKSSLSLVGKKFALVEAFCQRAGGQMT